MKPDTRLNGSDQLMRGFDHESRRHGFAGNHCQIILALDREITVEALRPRLAGLSRDFPILHSRPGGLFRPRWRPRRRAPGFPLIRVLDGRADTQLDLFNEPLHPGRGNLMRFDLVKRAGAAMDLVFTWSHMLMDATAAEHFLAAVGDANLTLPAGGSQPPGAPAAWRARLELIKKSVAQLDAFCEEKPRALRTRHPGAPRRLHHHTERFTLEETARIRAQGARLCGILGDGQFHAAAAALELHRLHQRLGCPARSYIIPMPVGLRPKGRLEPVFSNQVDMLMLQFLASQLNTIEPAIAALKAQTARALREQSLSHGRKLSDLFSFLPLPLYMKVLKHGLKGDICSLFFGDTAAVNPRLERFLGATVERFTHAAAVTPSPGLGVIFYYFRGALCLTTIHARTVLTEAEAAGFTTALRERLLQP